MADRMVKCVKLGREAPGLDRQPFKGEFGLKVFENVSKEAWRMWLEHSKMLVNEYRLDMTSPAHQATWFKECDKYFWGEGSSVPAEFRAVDPSAPKADPPKPDTKPDVKPDVKPEEKK